MTSKSVTPMSDPTSPAKALATLVDRAIADYDQAAALSWRSAPQAAIFDARGEALALTSIATVSSLTASLATLRSFFGEKWQPGDAAITNDVEAGAADACEMTVAAPIWVNRAAPPMWVVLRAFIPDLGGWELGGYSPQALDRWAEGARIEAAKVVAAGKYRREITDTITLNSRTPRLTLRCIHALVDSARSLGEGVKKEFAIGGEAVVQGNALQPQENQRITQALAHLGNAPRVATARIVAPVAGLSLESVSLSLKSSTNGIDIEVPHSAVASLPFNLGRHGAADCAIAAMTAALDLTSLRTGAIRHRVRVETGAPGLFDAPLPASVCLGRGTVGRALFLAVVDALTPGAPKASGEDLWQTYQAKHYDDSFDPKTGKITPRRAAAIRAREAEETSI
jgi:N-methylhydantoinase B/oxoprolinase/acetone carboxylase alpha subunit